MWLGATKTSVLPLPPDSSLTEPPALALSSGDRQRVRADIADRAERRRLAGLDGPGGEHREARRHVEEHVDLGDGAGIECRAFEVRDDSVVAKAQGVLRHVLQRGRSGELDVGDRIVVGRAGQDEAVERHRLVGAETTGERRIVGDLDDGLVGRDHGDGVRQADAVGDARSADAQLVGADDRAEIRSFVLEDQRLVFPGRPADRDRACHPIDPLRCPALPLPALLARSTGRLTDRAALGGGPEGPRAPAYRR